MTFTPVDILILIILLFFTINGARKGFIKEISRILGIVSGLILANQITPWLKPLLSPWISYEPALHVVSYFIIFICIVFIIGIIASVLQKFFELMLLGWLNRLLGTLLGLVKGLLIVSLVIFIMEAIPQTKDTRIKLDKESILFQVCNNLKETTIKSMALSEKASTARDKIEYLIDKNPIPENPLIP